MWIAGSRYNAKVSLMGRMKDTHYIYIYINRRFVCWCVSMYVCVGLDKNSWRCVRQQPRSLLIFIYPVMKNKKQKDDGRHRRRHRDDPTLDLCSYTRLYRRANCLMLHHHRLADIKGMADQVCDQPLIIWPEKISSRLSRAIREHHGRP